MSAQPQMPHTDFMSGRVKYKSLFGWGLGIYAIMFFTWSAFIKYGFTTGVPPLVVGLLILLVVALLAGRSLHFSTWKDILPYSLGWAVIVAVLDVIFTVPFAGWEIFARPSVLLCYVVIIVVPLLAKDAHSTTAGVEQRFT